MAARLPIFSSLLYAIRQYHAQSNDYLDLKQRIDNCFFEKFVLFYNHTGEIKFGGAFMQLIATSKIAVTLDNCSKKWYNMSQGGEKNGQNAAQ